jgi:hypothetical protein
MTTSPSMVEKILARIEFDPFGGCWLWPGSESGRYGGICHEGRHYRTHRVMFEHAHGPIPEGMVVMHKCDTPFCCNPAHLQAGTQHENLMDCSRKRRNGMHRYPERSSFLGPNSTRVVRTGEAHGRATLTDAQVAEMRAKHKAGISTRALGKLYGVNRMTAWKLVAHRSRPALNPQGEGT